jgi:peroxisomal 3,2-trans-enoyl-CoA isomerase
MGPSSASQMILFNQKLSAIEAEKYGLVGSVYSDHELVWKQIEEYSKLPKLSLKYSKQLIR